MLPVLLLTHPIYSIIAAAAIAATRPKTLEASLGAAPWKGAMGDVAPAAALVVSPEGVLPGAVPDGTGMPEETPAGALVGKGAAPEETGEEAAGEEAVCECWACE